MFNPVEFLVVASGLKGGEEAGIRTCVSRCYYACFLVARDQFNLEPGRGAEVHSQVIQEFRNRGKREVAARLHQLRRMRNRSDYDTSVRVVSEEAEEAFETAQSILYSLRVGA